MVISRIKIYCLLFALVLSVGNINSNVKAINLDEKLEIINSDLREEYGDIVEEIKEKSNFNRYIFADLLEYDFEAAIKDDSNVLNLNDDYTDTFGTVGGFIVYGEPHEFDVGTSRHRFLGYDVSNNQVSNPFFPDDVVGGSYSEVNIVNEPWESRIDTIRLNARTTETNNIIRNAPDHIKYRFVSV